MKELELEGYIAIWKVRNLHLPLFPEVCFHESFFQYLWKEGVITKDPAENLKPPKVEKKAPEILSIEEVDKLLQQPKLDTQRESVMRPCWNFYMPQACG